MARVKIDLPCRENDMLHMLSAVKLGAAVSPETFSSAVADLTAYLEQQKLVASTSANVGASSIL